MIKIDISEAQWQGQVEDYARMRGWEYMHVGAGLSSKGRWMTHTRGTMGGGWPDLILIRGQRLVVIELKARRGTLTDEQRRVLDLFRLITPDVHVFRPGDLPLVMDVLA